MYSHPRGRSIENAAARAEHADFVASERRVPGLCARQGPMRKWLGLGAVIVVVVLWYSYFSSSRAEQTERDEAGEAAQASAPPPMAAAPAQPAVTAVAPKSAPAQPAAPAPEQAEPVPDRNALFASRFESEPRDALWANEQEPALKKQLSEIEITDENLSAVECRRTVCRVTFKHPRVNERQAINMYSRALTSFGDVQLANHDPGSTESAHFYTLRKGYKLDAK